VALLSANTLPEDAIVNDDGNVALKYRRQQRVSIQCNGTGEKMTHIFNIRANISMAWIPPEDMGCALATKGGCCGVKKPGIIVLANENDVRRWTNGGGR